MYHLNEHEKATVSWVESLRVKDVPYGRYRMSNSTGESPFSSCFACFVRHMLHDLDSLAPGERAEWIAYLQDFQDSQSGLFSYRIEDNETHIHDNFYRDLQLTCFVLSALDTLGGAPRLPIHFLYQSNFQDPAVFRKWLEKQNWNRPWHAGNMVMFAGIILLYVTDRGIDPAFADSAKAFFDWHDETQNPRTGFWGRGKSSEYHFGIFGAYHQYTLYFYRNRTIPCAEQIIDRALLFQNIDGMFSPEMGGGGCEDIDVIDPLVQLSFKTAYRKADIRKALLRAYRAIQSLQHPNGGYVWGMKKRYGLLTGLRMILALPRLQWDLYHWYFLNKRYWRSQLRWEIPKGRMALGWTDGSIPFRESDLFATWFRQCALGAIRRALPQDFPGSSGYAFLKAPGLGWFPDEN